MWALDLLLDRGYPHHAEALTLACFASY